METVYFQGSPCHTYGNVPAPGDKAPCYTLVDTNLREVRCTDFQDTRVVLNIFPSLDTDVCAASVRRFNAEAAEIPDVKVLCVSMDLPFAAKRFCTAEGIRNLEVCSAFRSPLFGQKYGLQLIDGPLAGLLTRAVIIIDRNRIIEYVDLVDKIADEPDYRAALEVLRR